MQDGISRELCTNGIYGTDKPTKDKGSCHRKLQLLQVILTFHFPLIFRPELGHLKMGTEEKLSNQQKPKDKGGI